MTNRSRQISALAAVGGFFLLVIIGFWLRDVDLLGPAPEKSILLEKVHMIGWSKENKAWEMKADSGWITAQQETIILNQVGDGTLYQFGQLSGKKLAAREIQIHQRVHQIETRGQKDSAGKVQIPVTGIVDLHAPSTSEEAKSRTSAPQWAKLSAGYIRYNTDNKLGNILDSVTLTTRGNTIRAPSATFDYQNRNIEFQDDPTISGPRFRFKMPKLTYNFRDGRAGAMGDIAGTIYPKKKSKRSGPMSVKGSVLRYDEQLKQATLSGNVSGRQKDKTVQAGALIYDETVDKIFLINNAHVTLTKEGKPTDIQAAGGTLDPGTERATLEGNVLINQPGKQISAMRTEFTSSSHQLGVSGHVYVLLESGHTLLKKESIAKLRNLEAKQAAAEQTTLTCDRLNASTQSGDLDVIGNVAVHQTGKTAKASRGTYDDAAETITLTENVYLSKNGDWLKTGRIKVSIRNETFEATEGVETEFKMNKKEKSE